MKYLIVFGVFSSILTAVMASAYAQEISLICTDTEGNYFSTVRGGTMECFVYPSEINADGPGKVIVTDPKGKVVIEMAADRSEVTPLHFVAKKAGSYELTATWNVDGEPHSVMAPITVSKKQ